MLITFVLVASGQTPKNGFCATIFKAGDYVEQFHENYFKNLYFNF